jgi:rhodanese-related sulfurtransferase
MIDVRTMETRSLKIPKQKDCPVCAKAAEIVLQSSSPVCSVALVEEIDGAAAGDAVMIDVREREEWEAGHIPGALHLPLSLLQKNVNSFTPPPDGGSCVLYCQKGGRSRKAVEILLSAGFGNIRSLKGGYEGYSHANNYR